MSFSTGTGGSGSRHAWALACVSFAAYLPSFAGVFQFDDYNVIVNYPTVHSWQALLERAGGGVRPLLKATYTLNWTLGPGIFGFHLLNIGVHALNAVLLYWVGRELGGRWSGEGRGERFSGAALAAALLFALHPAQTEAVTYVSGRSSSLMASFYLGALLVYLRGGHWSGSALLFVLAAATRETAATLPAALVLCELCARDRPGWKMILRRQAAHWLLLLAGALVLLLDARYLDLVSFGFTRRSMGENLLTQIDGVSYLISRLVFLRGYNIDPALPVLNEWDAALAVEAALLAGLLTLGLFNLRARPWIGFGVLWFFLQLAPTNSVVPRLDVANDRQLYLAGWGLFLGLSVQVALLRPPRRIAAAVAGVLLALLAACSVLRQLDYASEIALWEASVRLAPWNARAHNNLGYAYQLAGRPDEARREYQTALYLEPGHDEARFNLMFLEGDGTAPDPFFSRPASAPSRRISESSR
jgi:tetratricopeptide (TPR) repeat protein